MAVIYARQSLDREGEGVAVARQIADCRDLARLKELEITDEFIDNDRSATRGERPSFLRLVEAIAAGQVDTIVCWHTDRLYRRVRDLVSLIEKAEKQNLRIFTVKSGDLDLTTPSGRMVAGMLGQASQYEVEHKGERQQSANAERAREGQRHFGNRPFGYRRVDGEITIVEEEAVVLREAVNRFIAGDSWHGIARDFRQRGIVGLKGRPFTAQNIRLRATNPALAGIRTYLGQVVTEDGKWPLIIDKATWERFQTVLAVRTQHQAWDKRIKYLGTGLYRCGRCGGVMKVLRDYGRPDHPPVYQCVNMDLRRRLEPVDEVVERVVLDRLSAPDVLKLLSPSEDVSALAAESRDLRTRMDGLAELFGEGILSAGSVRSEKSRLQAKLDALQSRIAAAEGGSVLSALTAATDVEGHWRTKMSVENKRRIIDALVTVTIQPTLRGGRNEFRPEHVVVQLK